MSRASDQLWHTHDSGNMRHLARHLCRINSCLTQTWACCMRVAYRLSVCSYTYTKDQAALLPSPAFLTSASSAVRAVVEAATPSGLPSCPVAAASATSTAASWTWPGPASLRALRWPVKGPRAAVTRSPLPAPCQPTFAQMPALWTHSWCRL